MTNIFSRPHADVDDTQWAGLGYFIPAPDITARETALVMYLLIHLTVTTHMIFDIPQYVERHNLRRHFSSTRP